MKTDFPYKKSYCRQCGNEMSRYYKLRNKEKIAAYNKQYKKEHKDDISIYNHNYNIENREIIQTRQTATQKERRGKDENFRLSGLERKKTKQHLKKKFCIKDELCNKRYSCSSKFIKEWFEYLFTDNMNWDNHGILWHLDHIKPCSSFDLTIEGQLEECYHWSNLRPLKAEDNQRKTNKIDNILIDEYKVIASNFKEKYTQKTSNY
jgi:hypothetical protein